jgi:predicted dehydrogenase
MALNVALLGAGNIGRAHLAALSRSSSANLVGLYDLDRARAEQRAAEFNVPQIYASWPALLADPKVQIVGIVIPPDLHRQFAIEALEAGKHVVSEKPFASNIAECDDMIAASRRTGRRLFMVQNRIYSPAYEKLRELLRQDVIGTVFLCQTTGFEPPSIVTRSPWLASARGGNGVLMAQSVHPAYSLLWLLGAVAQVSCTFGGRKVVEMVYEDTAIVTLRFASGVIGEMTATFGLAHGPADHAIIIFGSEGCLELHNQHGNPTQPQTLRAISPKLYGDDQFHDVKLPPVESGSDSFRLMWEDYLQAIETSGPARVSAVEGRAAVELIQAARQAAELGRAVTFPL